MENKRAATPQIATDSPRPGDFPIGSEISRAAARAMLEARPASEEVLTLTVRSVLLPPEKVATCVKTLGECGRLPSTGTGITVVDLLNVPAGLNAAELERWLKEDYGARTRIVRAVLQPIEEVES